MFEWFKRKVNDGRPPLMADMHSHLLPGLDDGVSTFEESEQIIRELMELGYRHIITTPHIMSDAFRNTPAGIASRLKDLKEFLSDKNIDITVTAAAEYYLDETLMKMLESNEPLLTFGEKYLLFETNFITEPFNLKEFIFLATTKGYKPVLAHPERYLYMHQKMEKMEDLLNRGVLMQMNISSFTGYYSRPVQQMANKLVDARMVHWLGTDCHHAQQIQLLRNAKGMRSYRKALELPLLNNTLV